MHINSSVAVCPPVVNLDEGSYHHSRVQHWLWTCWLDFIAEAKALTDGYKRVVIFDGDLSELDTLKRSIQLTTLNKATILTLIQETIAPLVDIADACYFIRGTAAHVGKSAWSEEATAKDTDGAIPEGNGKSSWWHYRGIASGVKLDVAHHANMGSVPWSKRNSANNMAAKIMYSYLVEMNQPAPDLALRAHNHTRATSGRNYRCQVDYLPAWTVKTEYAYRVGYENSISDIGGMVYLCENGSFREHEIMFYPKDAKQIWKLTM